MEGAGGESHTAHDGSRHAPVDVRRHHDPPAPAVDSIAVEVPVALVYNGISHAVMMATPADLEDFALGFSLSEGLLQHPHELYDIAIRTVDDGILVELEISAQRHAELRQRRRNLTGRTGCGLCGTESLDQAIRDLPRVSAPRIADRAIQHALAELSAHQPLQRETGASHGAAWCDVEGTILLTREDVGRHNALDKLIGALSRSALSTEAGFALVSSRGSYEMVQKSCQAGIGCLVCVSAPTSLAIDQARRAGLTLVGFARPGRHVIYHAPMTESSQSTTRTGTSP